MRKVYIFSIILVFLSINISFAQQDNDYKSSISQLPRSIKLDVFSTLNRVVAISFEQYLSERISVQVVAGPTFYAPYRSFFDELNLPTLYGAGTGLPLYLGREATYSNWGGLAGLSARGYLGPSDQSTYFLELGTKISKYAYHNSLFQYEHNVWDQLQLSIGARWIFTHVMLEVGGGLSKRVINSKYQSLSLATDFGTQQDTDRGGNLFLNVGYRF